MSNEKYTFLPWLRKGLGASISQTENTEVPGQPLMRPTFQAMVKINEPSGPLVTKDFKLYGPGDVTRLNVQSVLRTEPIKGVQNLESNYLPYMEFYEEDLPWRYSPSMPHHTTPSRLSPWFCLIALREDEFDINNDLPGKPYIVLRGQDANGDAVEPANIFPPSDQLWAWAHVQVNKEYAGTESEISDAVLADLQTDPTLAISRIICPRRLSDGSKYTCFLIPTFETGLRTALGQDPTTIPSLQKAWADPAYPQQIPFYYSWDFKTALAGDGDFETLAGLIQPQPVPEEAAGRDMYIGNPGMGLEPEVLDGLVIPGVDNAAVLKLEGALMPPVETPLPSITNLMVGTSHPYQPYYTHIKDLVELATTAGAADLPFGELYDPGVLPPLYGQWHAQSNVVDPMGATRPWLKELNLDPRHRVAAAIGTQIVKENQEDFMEEAWEQVEQVQNANQRIRQAELGARVGQVLFDKHIFHPKEDINDPVSQSRLLRMTCGSHHTLRLAGDGSATIKKHFEQSKVPDGMLTPAFRKLTRPTKKWSKLLRAAMDEVDGVKKPLTTDLIHRVNGSTPRAHERYPLYPKPMAPGDAVPADVLQAASESFESSLGNALFQEYGSNFANIPSSAPASNPATYTNAMSNLNLYSGTVQTPLKNAALAPNASNKLIAELGPMAAVFDRLQTNIEVWSNTDNAFVPINTMEQIMAAPQIDTPMYELLKGISPDYIIPNLHKLPENSATVMKVNTRFLESLFVGLNHEMGRELLWREYPTDQRGSYLRMFWDKSDNVASTSENPEYDITNEVHNWHSALGNNQEVDTAYLVLVIRGKLLEKFPDTLIFAQEAIFEPPITGPYGQESLKNAPRKLNTSGTTKFPVFTAKLGTDVTLVGFEMTVNDALGKDETTPNSGIYQYNPDNAGYFFALQERPGQLRFGLDEDGDDLDDIVNWDGLSWEKLEYPSQVPLDYPIPTVSNNFFDGVPLTAWGNSSADMAYILTQKPVLFLVHATDMI